MNNIQTETYPAQILDERGQKGALENWDGFEAVEEQRGGERGVEAVEELGRLVAHGDQGREVRVAGGGGGELEGQGAVVESEEEEEQVRVVVDMGGEGFG